MNPSIAQRYAKALIALTPDLESELIELAKAYRIPQVRAFFENPAFLLSERIEFIKKLGLCSVMLPCMELIIRSGRISILPELSKAYTKELDKKKGRVRVKITTSKPLDVAQMEMLSKALGSRLGVAVTPEACVEPRVGAGVRAQIGGLVFDNTLESQFSTLRRDLCSN